ncbi:MAG: fluoride efflux transporter CrcB [SAR324 cluster bacterium]|nr:fluoride efflux transporter CrcB [SAR324 cluster bacterium]
MISGWTWLVIGLGGGAGAVARFLVARQMGHWLGGYLPYGTLTVNAIGSWMLGFLSVYLMDRPEISPLVRLGLAVGFLGAFTTFSTFSYESVMLLQEGAFGRALISIGANLFFCLGLCCLGVQAARW